jgi:hypothetical protein
MARQKHQGPRASALGQTKTDRGQIGVCGSCGTILEYAGHVNIDLDLRLHRERDGCPGANVRYRAAARDDRVEFDRDAN